MCLLIARRDALDEAVSDAFPGAPVELDAQQGGQFTPESIGQDGTDYDLENSVCTRRVRRLLAQPGEGRDDVE